MDVRELKATGEKYAERTWQTPPTGFVRDLMELADLLPVKGWGQRDIALVAIGMASLQHPTDDYTRGYRDGQQQVLDQVTQVAQLLNHVCQVYE